MNKSRLSLIAAIGENRELGRDNKLLWHISEDLKRFKELTLNHPIIMGRKTFESIGRILPKRTNIIITHDPGYKIDGAVVFNSFDDAINFARSTEKSEIFIIGGGQVFQEAIKAADRLYLTIVSGKYDADVYFPEYSEFTKVISEENRESDGYVYTFLTLEK